MGFPFSVFPFVNFHAFPCTRLPIHPRLLVINIVVVVVVGGIMTVETVPLVTERCRGRLWMTQSLVSV